MNSLHILAPNRLTRSFSRHDRSENRRSSSSTTTCACATCSSATSPSRASRCARSPDAAGMDRQLARERYDLIVLDLMLPGEDGLSICRRLRGARRARSPIIMLTAKGDDVDRIVGLEMGADDYLPKPFNPRELVARIHAVLRRRPRRRPPGAPATEPKVDRLRRRSRSTSPRAASTRDGKHDPAHHRRIRAAQGAGRSTRAQPLSRDKLMELARGREYERVRPLDRRADLAPAQADRARSRRTRATSRPSGASATCSCRTAKHMSCDAVPSAARRAV